MKVALLAVDSNYPNLALMKISAYHKAQGDEVEWYTPFGQYDQLYMSKVFTFTPDYPYPINNVAGSVRKGGTGYNLTTHLPTEIDSIQPDYTIYPQIDKRTSCGFLTRGCIRKCPWCIVPKKEGRVAPYMDIDEITLHGARPKAILMDNNILAAGDYGLAQLEKIAERGYRVDFNQGLDARLVTDDIAALLAKIHWLRYIRFGCDTKQQIKDCQQAIEKIDGHGFKGQYFLYCIIQDLRESYERISVWRKYPRVMPFGQPYRDFSSKHQVIPQWQKDMASWVDKRWTYKACDFKDFMPRKGFSCREYFKE